MNLFRTLFAASFLVLAACSQPEQSQAESDSPKAEAAAPTVRPVSNVSANADAPAADNAALAQMEFEETTFAFGEIEQKEVVEHTFKFTNTGTAPLIISDIKTSCGCTTPSYTKDPVAPGETGQIDVRFNSTGKRGKISKTVTIYANVPKGKTYLYVKGQVNEMLDGPFKEK